MSIIIDEASAAALAPDGSLIDMELPEFPNLKVSLDPGDPNADPPEEPTVTATNRDGEEVTPPPVAAVLGALRYTPGAPKPKPTVVAPPTLALMPRYAGDENTVVGAGMTIIKTGAHWTDENGAPFPPGTVPIRTDWLYSDGRPAPGKHTDSEYLVDDRDNGASIKVVETAISGETSESAALGPVASGVSSTAPLADEQGNLLPADEQPPGTVMPPPSYLEVEESTRQNMEDPLTEPLPPATGADSGSPGSFTPAGCAIPADLAAMASVVANPVTAWLTGEHVVLGDASTCYWDGAAWTAGVAAAAGAQSAPAGTWPRTHAALDQIAADMGVTFTPDATTIDAKIAELEAAGIQPPPA